MSGQIDELKKLIQRNEDLNASDKSGHTALHYAVEKGNNEMVTTLIGAKCDVNVDDAIAILKMKYNDTLSTFYKDWVSEAISQGQYEVVWRFLEKLPSSQEKGEIYFLKFNFLNIYFNYILPLFNELGTFFKNFQTTSYLP